MMRSTPKPVCVRKQRGYVEAFIPCQHPKKLTLVDAFYRYSYLIPNNTTLSWESFGRLIKAHCSHLTEEELTRLKEADT